MDENELELDLDTQETNGDINRKDKRYNALANKFGESEKEREKLAKAQEKEEKARLSAEKERDFFKNFNQVSSKYQGAGEYQDKILEKVNAGYDIEDATISILAKEGKYTPTAPKTETERVAGGSAATAMTGNDTKSPQEMSQDERRATLIDMESKGESYL